MLGQRTRSLALALFCTLPGLSQTLAHRNWEGSGLTAQSWWSRATFCNIDRGESLHDITTQLDDLQSIGCDALVLDVLAPTTNSPAALASGTLDDADDLIEQIGRRKIRLVLHLPLGNKADSAATLDRVRFWLSRGVAGFLLQCESSLSPTEASTLLHQAHQATAAALGTRVLIAEGIASPSPNAAARRGSDAQLSVKRLALASGVSALRASLSARTTPLPILALDSPSSPEEAAKADLQSLRLQSAVLLGNSSAALLPAVPLWSGKHDQASQRARPADELRLWVPEGADPLAPSPHEELVNWYEALSGLRHTSAALRIGETTYLDRDSDGVLAWIVRPKGVGLPMLFVCNLSGHVVHLRLASDLRALGVRGSFLRTILTTEPGRQRPSLDAIDLAEEGVLAGEIH